MAIVRLKSVDGEVFEVTEEVARVSATIRKMLDSGKFEEDGTIWLYDIRSNILRKVIDWIVHHKDDTPGAPVDNGGNPHHDISDWDVDFMAVDNKTFVKLMLAATILDIKGLVVLVKKVLKLMERFGIALR